MKQIRIFLLSLILLLNSCIDNREAQIKKHRLEFEIRDLQNVAKCMRLRMGYNKPLMIGIDDYESLIATGKYSFNDLDVLMDIERRVKKKQNMLDSLNN